MKILAGCSNLQKTKKKISIDKSYDPLFEECLGHKTFRLKIKDQSVIKDKETKYYKNKIKSLWCYFAFNKLIE
jgi:hypothetical protein